MTHGRVVVVGGGIGGCSAALSLRDAGLDVVLLEASPNLGGLVVSFQVGGTPLECFYHHVFPHESDIQSLIERLGLKLDWLEGSMGVLVPNGLYPFTSPMHLLQFDPLPLFDRARTGVGALRMGRVRDWRRLDQVRAVDWLRHHTGERSSSLVWEPLLRAKFGPAWKEVPAAFMYGRFSQRSGARGRGGTERLGYLRGGFRRLFDALHERLVADGVDVRTETRAEEFMTDGDRVTAVRTAGETVRTDAVVFAGTLPQLPALVPAEQRDARWEAIGGLGALVGVLEVTSPVTPHYWINVCDDRLPFGAIIEHTNLVPASDYDDRHIVYLGRYFTHDEPIAQADKDTELASWVEQAREHVPGFDSAEVQQVHAFRTPYAAPLPMVGHLTRMPPIRADLHGLYVATTAQIYPQDRGMSEGVRLGRKAAEHVIRDLDASG